MYEEFCNGVSIHVDLKDYERIEEVYNSFDYFDSKERIYQFYKEHGMNGIEDLYGEMSRIKKRIAGKMQDCLELPVTAHFALYERYGMILYGGHSFG